ncbi:MAG: hypothetical protein Q9223_005593 [Gallowayella weberi]
MDVFYAYTYSTAAWFGVQTIPLMLSPKLIITILSTEARKPTVLEEYLCRSLAFTLLAFAVVTVLLTGTIPLSSTLSESESAEITADPDDPKAPYAVPTLTVTAALHAVTAIYTYMQYTRNGQIGFAFAELASGLLASIGCWWYACCALAGGLMLTSMQSCVWDGERKDIEEDGR